MSSRSGDGYTRDQYYLAAQADDVFMHPMGLVLVDGYSRFLPYYKSLLDKVYVDYNVWTVGEYKSFVEPITRDDMSPQDEEASKVFLDALWTAYQADVTAARGLAAPALQQYADDIVALLQEAGGDTAQARRGLRARRRAAALATPCASASALPSARTVRRRAWRTPTPKCRSTTTSRRCAPRRAPAVQPSKVAVIVAAGTILDGLQPPGAIGGDSTADLIRLARADEAVKALVLRVDSGGGSAFASDVILRELERFQETERPVVVSMGSVAASGGYWIAMSADEIWASPTTLDGLDRRGRHHSRRFQRALDWFGVHVDGIGTTELAGALDITRPLRRQLQGPHRPVDTQDV